MRIGVNALPLRVSGGGARYVFADLMDRLLALDDKNEYTIYAHPLGLGVVYQLARVHPHLSREYAATGRVRVVEVEQEDELFDRRNEFDLFFGPLNNLQPRIYDRPSVAILHDIQEQYFPQYFREADLIARREIYPEICRAATILVTISEFCKQSIVEKFGIEPEKIAVMYNAPQSGLTDRNSDDAGVWPREPLPDRYFFYPANCYPHKNHGLLLDALADLRDRGAATPAVVFTGFELPGGFPLAAEIERRNLGGLCRAYREVSVDELRWLYRHALALVMPTVFEGFGMPVVEALACGCPIACSDLPPLREIAGPNALYFEPGNRAQLVAHLETLGRDEALRQRMITTGTQAARRFCWDATARQLVELFSEAAARFHGFRPDTRRGAARTQPRIGVLIHASAGGDLRAAVRSILRTGYGNVIIRVVAPEGRLDSGEIAMLRELQVGVLQSHAGDAADWLCLRRFADDENLDLVGELAARGNELLPTALHSLAWAFTRDTEKALYCGEAWEQNAAGRVRTAARLRQLGDGLWKIEGFIHPEMMFFSRLGMDRWPEAAGLAAAGGADWRWELLKAAHLGGRLALVKRTFALCDATRITAAERMRAARTGIAATHSANGQAQGGWLSRLKPVLKPASRVLPGSLRAKGKRIWQHLTHET